MNHKKDIAKGNPPPKALACFSRGTAKMYNFEMSKGIEKEKRKRCKKPENRMKKK
jgi:hypothetical protein